MTKHVIVPQEELDKLEQARKDLYQLLQDWGVEEYKDTLFISQLTNITSVCWRLANRKWPEVKGEEQ